MILVLTAYQAIRDLPAPTIARVHVSSSLGSGLKIVAAGGLREAMMAILSAVPGLELKELWCHKAALSANRTSSQHRRATTYLRWTQSIDNLSRKSSKVVKDPIRIVSVCGLQVITSNSKRESRSRTGTIAGM